jgi:hypothetical protein
LHSCQFRSENNFVVKRAGIGDAKFLHTADFLVSFFSYSFPINSRRRLSPIISCESDESAADAHNLGT